MPAQFVGLTVLSICLLSISTADDNDGRIFGWAEKVTIEPRGTEVKAKLDSGTLASSIQAEDIERFRRGDDDWVRFTVGVKDDTTGFGEP